MLFFLNLVLTLTLFFSFIFLIISFMSPKSATFWSKTEFTKKSAAIFYAKVFFIALILEIGLVSFFGDKLQKDADKTKAEIVVKDRVRDSLKVVEDSLKVVEENNQYLNESIEVGVILDKYNDNRIAADKLYLDKDIIIYGYINSIEQVDKGEAYISILPLYQKTGYMSIICYIKSEDVVNFNSKDEVYVKGKFKGVDDGYNISALKIKAEKIIKKQ